MARADAEQQDGYRELFDAELDDSRERIHARDIGDKSDSPAVALGHK